MARREATRAGGTANQVVPGNAAKIAAAPVTNMYRNPGDTAGQPAAAPPNVTSWMGTIGHLAPGDGTMDTDMDTTSQEASMPHNSEDGP